MGRTALPLALLLGVLPAQEILWQRIGVDWQYQFRAVYNSIGDVDRDGYPELLALMGVIVSQTQAPVQELWVLSGRDGSTLRKLREPVGRIFEMTAATGDLDGDGIGDYALKVRDFGQPPSNYVEARSGIDDRLLWSVQGSLALAFGAAILGDLDLDGDGRPNVVITFPNGGPNNRALVFAYDHQGNLLYQVGDTGDDLFYGEDGRDSIGIVGDLDGDGAEGFVLGGGYVGSGGGGVVLSGRDGTVLQVGVSPVRSDNLGRAVDGCGDIDGDGVPDFVAGNRPLNQRGVAMAFSGASGEVIHTWTSTQYGPRFDGRLVRGGDVDVDRDGVGDIIVGAWGLPGGGIFVFSGRDGQPIHQTPRAPFNGALGFHVVPVDRWPGSPFGAYIVSDPQRRGSTGFLLPYLGEITVYHGNPVGAAAFGTPCAGTLELAPKIGIRTEPNGARITLHDAPARTPAWLLIGTSNTTFGGAPLPFPLDDFGFFGCSLRTSIEAALLRDTGVDGLARGYADVVLPGIPAAQGTPLFAQWLVLGQGRLAPGGLSDGLTWNVP